MYFVYIYDQQNKGNEFFNSLSAFVTTTGLNIVKSVECKNGIPVNNVHSKMLNILAHEDYRAPIIIDAISAKYHYDLFNKNDVIVLLPHEMDRTADLSEVNPFNEEQAVAQGAKFIYLNDKYFEEHNSCLMPVVPIGSAVGFDYIAELSKKYEEEHMYYPSVLTTRKMQNLFCGRPLLLSCHILNPSTNVIVSRTCSHKAPYPRATQSFDLMVANIKIRDKETGKEMPLQIKL